MRQQTHRKNVLRLFIVCILIYITWGLRCNVSFAIGISQFIPYLSVHSFAVLSCAFLSARKASAISGTRGSSGLGSSSKETSESKTFEIDSAGDQLSFKISRQMPPFALMLPCDVTKS